MLRSLAAAGRDRPRGRAGRRAVPVLAAKRPLDSPEAFAGVRDPHQHVADHRARSCERSEPGRRPPSATDPPVVARCGAGGWTPSRRTCARRSNERLRRRRRRTSARRSSPRSTRSSPTPLGCTRSGPQIAGWIRLAAERAAAARRASTTTARVGRRVRRRAEAVTPSTPAQLDALQAAVFAVHAALDGDPTAALAIDRIGLLAVHEPAADPMDAVRHGPRAASPTRALDGTYEFAVTLEDDGPRRGVTRERRSLPGRDRQWPLRAPPHRARRTRDWPGWDFARDPVEVGNLLIARRRGDAAAGDRDRRPRPRRRSTASSSSATACAGATSAVSPTSSCPRIRGGKSLSGRLTSDPRPGAGWARRSSGSRRARRALAQAGRGRRRPGRRRPGPSSVDRRASSRAGARARVSVIRAAPACLSALASASEAQNHATAAASGATGAASRTSAVAPARRASSASAPLEPARRRAARRQSPPTAAASSARVASSSAAAASAAPRARRRRAHARRRAPTAATAQQRAGPGLDLAARTARAPAPPPSRAAAATPRAPRPGPPRRAASPSLTTARRTASQHRGAQARILERAGVVQQRRRDPVARLHGRGLARGAARGLARGVQPGPAGAQPVAQLAAAGRRARQPAGARASARRAAGRGPRSAG